MKIRTTLIVAGLLTGSITFAQQGPPTQGGQGAPPSPQERLKHIDEKLNKELSLSATQQSKVNAAFSSFFAEMDKLHGNKPPQPGEPPVKKADADRLEKQRDDQIKLVLSAEQFTKYKSIEQSLRPPRPQRQGANDTPPQPIPAKQ